MSVLLALWLAASVVYVIWTAIEADDGTPPPYDG